MEEVWMPKHLYIVLRPMMAPQSCGVAVFVLEPAPRLTEGCFTNSTEGVWVETDSKGSSCVFPVDM